MSKFRYVAIAPGRADGKHISAMGTAVFLHDFLIDHQTDADGRVHYGSLVSYEWIRARFKNCPPRRTLERWMARLLVAGYIEIEHGEGFQRRIRILNQKKFPAPAQRSLFPLPVPVPIRGGGKAVEKPVENGKTPEFSCATSGIAAVPLLAEPTLYDEKNDETIKTAVRELARSKAVEITRKLTESETEQRRRLLLEQAETLKARANGSG
jgi:hypothetical protein